MGLARTDFSFEKYENSIKTLQTVVEMCPKSPLPYELLALIYNKKGDANKELNAKLIAAHLRNKAKIWRDLSSISFEMNRFQDCVYCINKVIRMTGKDDSLIWDRSVSYYNINNYKKALSGFKYLYTNDKDPEILFAIVKCYHSDGNIINAIKILEDFLNEGDINQLAEMGERKRYLGWVLTCKVEAKQFLQSLKGFFYLESLFEEKMDLSDCLPNITENLFICCIETLNTIIYENKEYNEKFFSVYNFLYDYFFQAEINQNNCSLFEKFANCFFDRKNFKNSLSFYMKIFSVNNLPIVHLKIANSYKGLKQYEDAIKYYKQVLSVFLSKKKN